MGVARTGWERENRVHFDEIVENYDKIRWDYPSLLFSDAIEYSGVTEVSNAIEIGPGTGKATAPFLDTGCSVKGVEMSLNMTEYLRKKYINRKNLSVITSTFEDSELQKDFYDLVYAASSFHWVDAKVGCPKVMEILKTNGSFVLFRNNAIPHDRDKLYDAVQEEYEKYYYSFYTNDSRPVKPSEMTYEDFLKKEEIYRGFRINSLEEYGFIDISMKLYEKTLRYSAKEYIALLETYSDHRLLPEKNRKELYSGIEKAIEEYGDGYLQLDCIFQLYMGRKP